MSTITGNLLKMRAELAQPIRYFMRLGDQEIFLNDYLDKTITLEYLGVINCIHCSRKTNKSFQQGYCYPCMQRLNECGNCAIFPERCQVENGTCPTDDWAHSHCHSQQIVYLANASGLKVGITRDSHIPTRWIDQGAVQAIPIFKVKNRYQSGLMEVAIKQYVSDRTNWRDMLKNNVEPLDMVVQRDTLLAQAADGVDKVIAQYDAGTIIKLDEKPIELHYPVLQYPTKIKSLSLDKTPEVSGKLLGIKGQYLLLDTGVINIRKFGGYQVKVC